MKEFMQTRERLAESLNSDAVNGLTEESAEKSREKHGTNLLTRQKPVSLFRRILAAASEPMLLLLIIAGAVALTVNIIRAASGGHGDFLECAGIFAAIALSVVITVVMEGKSAKAFEALNKISDNTVIKAVRGGEAKLLNQQDIVVGDVLILATGDKIPADCRLLDSTELQVNESALTGESVPAKKNAEKVFSDEKTPLAERANMIYSGTFVTGGFCRAMVTAVGDGTEFGAIAKELTKASSTSTPLQEKLAKLGKWVTIFGVAAAVIVFIAELISFGMHGGLHFTEVMEAFVTSIVLIVAAVPEGLPTIVAVSLSLSVIKLSKQNALVKKMIAAETVGCINVICSDKTGTLTENKMTVKYFYDKEWHDSPDALDNHYLIHNICLNSTADLGGDGTFLGNPTECALLSFYARSAACKKSGKSYTDERKQHLSLKVFPFSSELKHMTAIERVDGETVAFVKGSPERVMAMCDISQKQRAEIDGLIKKAQKQAMRLIAFSHKTIEESQDFEDEAAHAQIESGMVFDGFAAIADPLRADVKAAVKECRRAGVELKILTGDNIVTASAIAEELNILGGGKRAYEAAELESMTDEELSAALGGIAVIARSTPTVKMRVVNLLKAAGNVVAVTGDGINDAPALKNADVGLAMGITGTEVSKEAADVVLLDDSFSTIVKAVKWGRGLYENFKRFIQFQLTVNVSSVVVVLCSILLGFDAPFTALQLLWINIIMDGPPALSLGLEPNHGDLMSRPPTKRNENILSRAMLLRIGLTGLYVSALFLCQYAFDFLGAGAAQMRTVLFTLFALIQLFNAFNCRELHSGSIFKHLFKNRLFLITAGITFALQIVIIQFAGAFFGTVPLSLTMWLKIIGLSLSVILLSEIIKVFVRLFQNRKKSPAVV